MIYYFKVWQHTIKKYLEVFQQLAWVKINVTRLYQFFMYQWGFGVSKNMSHLLILTKCNKMWQKQTKKDKNRKTQINNRPWCVHILLFKRSQLKIKRGKNFTPTGILTMVPWNCKPECYQWATLRLV